MERHHILIVEDDEELNALYANRLARVEYDVHSVYTVAAALDHLEEQPAPDVVITDLDLPDGSGTQIMTYLRSNKKFVNTRIIAVSAHAFIKESGLSGFQPDTILVKPVSPRYINIAVYQELKFHTP